MIVADFNIERIAVNEPETDPPLVVDGNGMLPSSFASQRVESVTGRCLQVIQPGGEVYILKLPDCSASDIGGEPLRPSLQKQLSRPPVRERLDHDLM